MNSQLTRLLRFDKIRISKLINIIQAACISLILSIYIGTYVDKICGKLFNDTELKDISSIKLIFEILIQFSITVIATYYIGKITKAIPNLFSITDAYCPNKKNELSSGIDMGSQVIFFSVQKLLIIKIIEISTRASNYF